jgi:predicted GH43/DUF377 family glycosyl hydrolase
MICNLLKPIGFRCVVIIFLALHMQLLSNIIDIEKEMTDSFVLSTKKLEIPGYPDAFNPSILKWSKNKILISFRTGGYQIASESDDSSDPMLMSFRFRDPLSGSTNGIGLILLDDKFNPITEPQEIEIPCPNPYFAKRQQDPRLIQVGNHIYIVYSNFVEGIRISEIRRMFVVELFFDGSRFYTGKPECFLHFEGENENRWQKNWVPFNYGGVLLLAYSINPHKVLRPIFGTGECSTVASPESRIEWSWGVLRGGTPALLDGNEYLGFFHSSTYLASIQSNGVTMQHYFMGAYTFNANPPFNVTRVSPKPIVGKNFYNGPIHNTWKPLRVVFPCGYIFDEKYVWVAYGRQDHEMWVAKIDKNGLYKSLVSPSSEK